jgi:hypothetical protein
MFSFFSKSSKKSPVEPSKADDSATDFVLIGGGGSPAGSLYPSAQLPAQPAPHTATFNRQFSLQYTSYTQNVPFKLNPILSSNPETEFLEMKIREITNIINQISSTKDYDFKLERSIVDQS